MLVFFYVFSPNSSLKDNFQNRGFMLDIHTYKLTFVSFFMFFFAPSPCCVLKTVLETIQYNTILSPQSGAHKITPTQRFPTQPNPTHLYLWIIKTCNCPLQDFQWYEIQGKGAKKMLRIMKNICFYPWVIFYHFAHFSNFPIVAWEKKHKMLVFMEYVCM